nr:9811_t:CDS:2 [Entrophospora candida]
MNPQGRKREREENKHGNEKKLKTENSDGDDGNDLVNDLKILYKKTLNSMQLKPEELFKILQPIYKENYDEEMGKREEVEKGEEVEKEEMEKGEEMGKGEEVAEDQQSDDLIASDIHHCTNSRVWTKEDKTILLKHCLRKRINTNELYELGLLKKSQAMSKQWKSMKNKIKKSFDVDF